MSYFDDASLVFIPSGTKVSKAYSVKPIDGSGDLTFTRSNDTATRVNSAGLIEKVRTNLALRSQSFATSATWSTVSGTITNNAGTAPDGTSTASKIVAGNSDPYVYQPLTLSGSVAVSCYVKGIGSSIGKVARILVGASMTDVTMDGTWQRISVAHTASGAELYGLEIPNPAVSGDEVLMWGFQVEYGDVMTDYIATTTAAVSVGPVANVPRLDYLGSTCGKLLLEPQRTNLALYSEQFNNAAWLKRSNISVTSNAITAPDGTVSADKIAASDNATVDYGVFQIVANGLNTYSVFAKKGEMNYVYVGWDNTLTTQGVYFNLNNGTISSNPSSYSASITDYGNGWYRCSIYVASNVSYFFISPSVNGTTFVFSGQSGNGIYIWGAQAEVGAYPSSYVNTLGSASTRGSDSTYKASISTLIGQTEGVAFIDFVWNGLTGIGSYPRIIELWGDSNNYIQLYSIAGTTSWGWDIYNGGTVQFTGGSTMALGRNKIAIAYKLNDMAIYKNGTLVASDTSCTVPATSSLGVAGSYIGSVAQLAASVNQTLLFKTRLPNSQLAELTSL